VPQRFASPSERKYICLSEVCCNVVQKLFRGSKKGGHGHFSLTVDKGVME
jgi:hypothetical protein